MAHLAILDSGRPLFLRRGFDRTTMDEVAALAGVSKQTVYKHFADKQSLFTALIVGEIDATERITHDHVTALGRSDDIEADLRHFARQHVRDVTAPHVVRMRRIVIAEAERLPELARTWHGRPGRAHEALAEQIATLTRRGLLRVGTRRMLADLRTGDTVPHRGTAGAPRAWLTAGLWLARRVA